MKERYWRNKLISKKTKFYNHFKMTDTILYNYISSTNSAGTVERLEEKVERLSNVLALVLDQLDDSIVAGIVSSLEDNLEEVVEKRNIF